MAIARPLTYHRITRRNGNAYICPQNVLRLTRVNRSARRYETNTRMSVFPRSFVHRTRDCGEKYGRIWITATKTVVALHTTNTDVRHGRMISLCVIPLGDQCEKITRRCSVLRLVHVKDKDRTAKAESQTDHLDCPGM
jgi:hypothetical protein